MIMMLGIMWVWIPKGNIAVSQGLSVDWRIAVHEGNIFNVGCLEAISY